MTLTALRLTTLIVAGAMSSGAMAQTAGADPHHPNTAPVPVTPGQAPGAQPAQPGMGGVGSGVMGQGMMGQGMMREMMQSRMSGGMPMQGPHLHLKIMFAIVDTDGDGTLAFEEEVAVHKRIFDKVDANKDGKVTIEEIQTFFRE